MSTDNTMSRRKAIGSMGAVLATTIVSPALAGGLTNTDIPSGTAPEDPTTKYVRPPFKEQTQPWPGLVSKMDPRPDHGEKSYKGSGRLKGRKALITGDDSGMGRAAAIAYAREGADVAINYYPTEEEDAKEVIALIKAEGRKGIAISWRFAR
ncbi:SDR family NAD(P)-dependent oxidoreductase [Flavobacterium zepuense]|uniref:SDR family NAD(P)-dependent oxidoreductase n=1 Tax=Flavobacterium zepuense TaxID=2593302 RepID=UPI0021CEA4AC|nr:SDR family NAD(P)-dependent oxidoreductase [Flavobacterium zepuense]